MRLPASPSRRSARAGLSLLELLVALALLALVAGGLAGSLDLAIRLFDRAQAEDRPGAALALRTGLRSWLAAARPPLPDGDGPPAFRGTASGMTFLTSSPAAFRPEASLTRVELRAEAGDLILEAGALAADGAAAALQRGTLASTVSEVRFSYHAGQDGGWRPTWDDPTALPAAVRIEAEGGDPPWPPFTVRLLLR